MNIKVKNFWMRKTQKLIESMNVIRDDLERLSPTGTPTTACEQLMDDSIKRCVEVLHDSRKQILDSPKKKEA